MKITRPLTFAAASAGNYAFTYTIHKNCSTDGYTPSGSPNISCNLPNSINFAMVVKNLSNFATWSLTAPFLQDAYSDAAHNNTVWTQQNETFSTSGYLPVNGSAVLLGCQYGNITLLANSSLADTKMFPDGMYTRLRYAAFYGNGFGGHTTPGTACDRLGGNGAANIPPIPGSTASSTSVASAQPTKASTNDAASQKTSRALMLAVMGAAVGISLS